MVIQENDFKLTATEDSALSFDLELLYIVRPKGKESREEFKDAGYGISIEKAIKKIAQYRVHKNHKDEAISLLTYFKEFKKEVSSLVESCKI